LKDRHLRTLGSLRIRSLDHLCWQLRTSREELDQIIANLPACYRQWNHTKNGKTRPICEPLGRLKIILRNLNSLLQRIHFPSNAHGGIRGRSTRSNALPHIWRQRLFTTDVKDFFPSISGRRVYHLFSNTLECTPDVARYLTLLTTFKGCLPQGSPTSPVIANLVARPLACRLETLSRTTCTHITTFVDDIAVSGGDQTARVGKKVETIVEQEGFQVKREKSRMFSSGSRHDITGVRVDHGLDVPRSKLDELREGINAIAEASESGAPIDMKTVKSLKGKICYIRGLNRGAAKTYQKRLQKVLSPVNVA
jgi:RNA-directed DNA polymerase